MAKTETALDRVKKEKKDLDTRMEKLANLIGKVRGEEWEAHKKLFESLSGEQKKLLVKQYKVMKEYSRILEKRIRLWIEE